MRGFLRRRKADKPWTESPFECSRDGLIIRGVELRPEGTGLPAAVVCHGFMANRDTVRQYAETLAGLGYAAYMFDFCGGCVVRGRSDGKTTDMSVLTEISDLEAVIEYARSLPYTGDALLLMGASQGGFVSALTAAKHPDWVEKLVLLYPALCIPDDARAGKMMFAKFDPQNVPELVKCGPMKLGRCYVEDVLAMDPFAEISLYTGPVLIIHGTKDKIVDIEYAKKAQKAYSDATLHIIEKAKHGFKGKYDAEALSYLRDFAKK